MKHLIIVRHGEYGRTDHLTEPGSRQIKVLAYKLQDLVNGASVHILTSPADRARESAEIIGSVLESGLEEHAILWSGGDAPQHHGGNCALALELIRSHQDKADALVLVTHYEYVEALPGYFAKQELGTNLHSRLIGKGEAWIVDCEQKTLTHLR